MTRIHSFDRTSCALLVGMTLTGAACGMPADRERAAAARLGGGIVLPGAPAASFTSVHPLDGDAIVYSPLAPRIPSAPLDGQLSIDVLVRNDESSSIDVDHVRLSYAGGALPSVLLENDVKKRCAGDPVDLVDDRAIAPNQTCRLFLLPDQKIPVPAPGQITIDVYFSGFAQPVSTTRTLKKYRNTTFEGSYRFPAAAEDLAALDVPDVYWSARSSGVGSHHRTAPESRYAHDGALVRWDDQANDWTDKRPNKSGNANSDYLVWGVPVYAMADGEVLHFENDQDDNQPGDESSAANYFEIRHGDEVARYYHLKKGSLNADLLHEHAMVKEGQKLGEVGNSGHSTHPHLHIEVSRDEGMPLLFHEAFVIDREAALLVNFDTPFTAVEDQGMPWEADLVWPSPFRRADAEAAAAIRSVAITHASSSRAVTATVTTGGNLSLSSWDVGGDGAITHRDDDSAGGVSELAIAHPDNLVVTAFRNSQKNLQLITWSVANNTGVITRLDDDSAGEVSKVAVTELPVGSGVATAFRNKQGELGVIAWETSGFGDITRKGSATAEAISGEAVGDLAITTVRNPFNCVVTAARNPAGDLVLTSWEVTGAKQLIRRGDDTAGGVSAVALATVRVDEFGRETVVAAVRDHEGELQLIAWDVTPLGQLVRRGEVQAGEISDLAIATDGTQRQIVTAVRDNGGDLKLIAWEVSSSGTFVREGEAAAGAIQTVGCGDPSAPAGSGHSLALTSSFTSGGRRFAMPAMCDGSGAQRLISWQTNLTP